MIFLFFDLALLAGVLVLFILLLINGSSAFLANTVSSLKFLCPYILFIFPFLACVIKTVTSAKRVLPSVLKVLFYYLSSFLNILVIYAMFWYLIVFKAHDPATAGLATFMSGIFMMIPMAAHVFLTNSTKKDLNRTDSFDIYMTLIAIVISVITLVVQYLLIRQFDDVTFKAITAFLFGK